MGTRWCWKPYLTYFNTEKIRNILVLSLSKNILKKIIQKFDFQSATEPIVCQKKSLKAKSIIKYLLPFPLNKMIFFFFCNELRNKMLHFDTKYKNKISNGN